jgi:hypothetical protein
LRGFTVVRACRSYDPEFFFPIGKTGRAIAEIQRAKAVCAACPVRAECLAFALETHQDYGIWATVTMTSAAPCVASGAGSPDHRRHWPPGRKAGPFGIKGRLARSGQLVAARFPPPASFSGS